MTPLVALLVRECQEHRATFLYLPLAIVVFSLVIMLMGLGLLATGQDSRLELRMSSQDGVSSEQQEYVVDDQRLLVFASLPPDIRERALDRLYNGAGAVLMVTLWFVVLFYLLDTLFSDRRDRSVLFWKSMPVSDMRTVLSKLLVGVVLVPACYLVAIMLTHLLLLLVTTVAALAHPIDVWDTFWAPANLPLRWARLAATLVLGALWILPLFGWVLLVSSWARSVPLVWAIAVPVALMIVDGLLIPGDTLTRWILAHANPLPGRGESALDLTVATARLLSIDFVVSLAVATTFVSAAIWLRRRTDEI